MEKLTITRVEKELLKKVKIQAAKEGVSMQLWIDRALKKALNK